MMKSKGIGRENIHLRIFSDETEKMNLSVLEAGGSAIVVSPNLPFLRIPARETGRPLSAAAPPEIASPLCAKFAQDLQDLGIPTQTGSLGAQCWWKSSMMSVTINLESETWHTNKRKQVCFANFFCIRRISCLAEVKISYLRRRRMNIASMIREFQFFSGLLLWVFW